MGQAKINPGAYVAGSYEAMVWVSEEASRIKTFKNTARICYDQQVHCAKQSVGKLVNVMMAVEGDSDKVVAKLFREGIPSRLDIPAPPELNLDTSDGLAEDEG